MLNEAIVNFEVFEDATRYLGMASVTLPSLTHKNVSVEGAGIAGTVEAIIPHLDALDLGLSFRTQTTDAYRLHELRDHNIDLRISQQARDSVSGQNVVQAVKHVAVCRPKEFNPGNVAPAAAADASGTYGCTIFATYIDGQEVLYVDKLNYIYRVNGVDYLAEHRAALGL